MTIHSSLLLLTLFLLFFQNSFAQNKNYHPQHLLPVAQLQEDFQVLYTAFSEGHPAWGHYHSADSMDYWFEQTRQSIRQPLTEKGFLKLLYPLIQKMACGHTRLNTSKAAIKYQKKLDQSKTLRRYPPFKAMLVGDKMYITKATSSDSLLAPPGTEILQINGIKAATIQRDLFSQFTTDGYNQTHQREQFNSNFDGYFRFYYGDIEQYEVELVKANGDTSTVQLKATSASLKQRLAAAAERKKKRWQKGEILLQKKNYSLLKIKEHPSIAIMDIRGFRQRYGKGFYRRSFRYLEEQKIGALIIDLRKNGGGSVRDVQRLLSYLSTKPATIVAHKKRGKFSFDRQLNQKIIRKFISPLLLPFYFKKTKTEESISFSSTVSPKPKNYYWGKVYVLIDGGTFSASVMLSAFLRDQNKAQFIGQESGGGETGTNAFILPQLTLPNSGIRTVFPLYAIQHQVKAADRGLGLQPDYEVYYSLEDILEGRDLEWEKVLGLVEGGG